MAENGLQECFAERIGGRQFGRDDRIYKFEKIKRAKVAARKAQPDVALIDMGVGEPDDMAFPEVVAALSEEAAKWENRTYTDNGIMPFRLAVRDYMRDVYGVELDAATEICHSVGSKSALSLIPACFIDPGDASILTTPGYPVMGTWTDYLGGRVIRMPITPENAFFPELEQLGASERAQAKLLYLNYPNNPTGAAASVEALERAVAFAQENQILIVYDAAYGALRFDGVPHSILAIRGAKDIAIELHSMSKGFNMTGWRLGWVCGNPNAVAAFAHVKDNCDSGQFAAIQLASATALNMHARITPLICAKYKRRLDALAGILCESGFNASCPDGSFFLYTAAPTGTTDGEEFENGEAFSQWLIRTKLISTVPWDDAGHFVRFSATFAASSKDDEARVLGDIRRRLSDVEFIFSDGV